MKNTLIKLSLVAAAISLTACSGMQEIPERESYAQPKWYASCAQAGFEGFFWWKEEYAYSCGAGESRYQQAAEEQMYAVAMNNFAKRINGEVNSETIIDIKNDKRNTSTNISYKVSNTRITQHLQEERSTFVYAGQQYTFVKLKMPKKIFDQLLAEAKASRE
tara:strand:- start:797 stop:1282 length:486 start_codon:yes stop_codon:yes gene_type:complete